MTAPFSFFDPRPAPGPFRRAPVLLPELSTSAPQPSDIERALVSGQLDPAARAQMAARVQAENAQAAHNAPRSLLGGVLQNLTIPAALAGAASGNPMALRGLFSAREATNALAGADPTAPGADLLELLGSFAPIGPEMLATRGVTAAAEPVADRAGLLAKALGLPDPRAAVRPDVGPLKSMLERIAAPEALPEEMTAVQRELSDAKGYATRVLGDPEASPELVQTALARLEDAHLQHELAAREGFTYDPRTRQLVPKEGFVVANPPGAQSVDRPTGTVGSIREALQRNAELLRQPDMMLGGWTDQKVGRDMIEVSQIRPDLEDALAIARQRGEKAVWDLARGVEIPVDYTKAAPNSAVQTVVSDYLRARPELAGARLPDVPRVDEARAAQMAGVYERLKSDPTNPEVQRAYRALVDETKAQYQALQDAGYRFEFVDEDPYKSSAEMTRDLRENRRLRVFKSKEGDHPLLTPEENTIFRAVHDAIGHGAGGTQFGPHGEELAYRKHAAMFSPLARRAMATETRGQNSWVNFGPHRALPPAQRPFAEQKAALWPEEFLGDYGDMPTDAAGGARTAKPASWIDRLGQALYQPGVLNAGVNPGRRVRGVKPKTDRPFRAAGVVAVNKKGERRVFEGAIHPQAAYKAARAGFRVDPEAEALGHNGFVLQDGTYVSRADAPKYLKKGEVPKAERLKMGEEPADPLSDFQLDSIPSAPRRRAAPAAEGLSLLHPDGSETRTVPTPFGPMTGRIPPKPGKLPNGLAPDRFFRDDYFFGTPEGVREPRRRYGYETHDAIYDIVVDQGGGRTYIRNGKVVEPHRIHRAIEQQYGLPAEGPLGPEHRHNAPVEGHLRLMTDSIPTPARASQTELKLGDNLFDTSPEALREVPTFGAHAPMEQPPGPGTEKTATNVAGLRRRGQSPAYRRAAEVGLGLGGLEWYNTQQLYDRFVGELGAEAGERAFRRFMDMVAATSPGSNVSTNIKLGSNFFTMAEQGALTPEILREGQLELAPGYKHRFQSTHNAKAARILEEGGLNPVADPKTARFGAALSGNYANVPVDLHISRGLKLTNTAGKPIETPESWQYGAIEDLLRAEAARVGVTPAQYQAAAWVGLADKTGVGGASRRRSVPPFLAILEERLGLTAKRRGTTKEKALRALIRGEAPLE